MIELDTDMDYDGNIPESFRAVQLCLDSFVEINYETLLGMVSGTKVTETDIRYYRSKAVDIIRNGSSSNLMQSFIRF